jgi:hypothetical protein
VTHYPRDSDAAQRGGAKYDCIHPIDGQAGLTLYELKKQIGGKECLMGHIDIMTWSEERIVEEVGRAENEFREVGLIIDSTSGLSMDTVNDKLSALYPQWKKRGRRG